MGLREKKTHSMAKKLSEKEAFEPTQNYQLPSDMEDDSVELDVIERLKSNISMLEDLNSRLHFMNIELESVLGSKSK